MPLLDLILGYDCNLACDYCTITPAMRRRSLSTPAVLRELRAGRAQGYDRVSFTGGEPTIRRDLLGLIGAARALGYGDVKVQSNGLLFAQASNVERIVAAGASTFHVSIHTHEPQAYERMVRRAGTFELMERGLSNLASAGLDPVADVILERDTHRRLPSAVRWLHARGVRRADLWFVSLTDANAERPESMPRMSDVVPSMHRAFALADELAMTLRSLHVPRCLLGASADRAHDPGAEQVRVVTPDDVFELSGSKLTPRVHVPACDGCPERGRCPGVRPDYLARYGDEEIATARGAPPSLPAAAPDKRRLPVT